MDSHQNYDEECWYTTMNDTVCVSSEIGDLYKPLQLFCYVLKRCSQTNLK